jgi:peptidyl-prolyl cis-trans isomerase D
MIRFLQRDSRVVKAFFVVIIGDGLGVDGGVPDSRLTGQSATAADTYAVIYPHWYSRFLSSALDREPAEGGADGAGAVGAAALRRQPDDSAAYFEQRVGQQLVQQQVLLEEADKLGIRATDDDVRQYLQTGPGRPGALSRRQVHRRRPVRQLIATRFNMSVPEFEDDVKNDIVCAACRR